MLRVGVGEPATVQPSVLYAPAVTIDGAAVKLAIAGLLPAMTVTIAVAVMVPNPLLAARVYDVVAEGLTVADVPVTVPTPKLMLTVGEPVTTQLSVLDWPAVILAGVAVKLAMVGLLPAGVAG